MSNSFLGTLKSTRGLFSLSVLVTAFLLSIMVINTRNKCVKSKDPEKFKSDTSLMYYISLLIIIVCIFLFGYDIGSYFKFF